MNISTIEQGEELLKKSTPGPWLITYQGTEEITSKKGSVVSMGYEGDGGFSLKGDRELVMWLVNHASELLQMAREVEELKKKVENLQWHYNDMQSRNPDA